MRPASNDDHWTPASSRRSIALSITRERLSENEMEIMAHIKLSSPCLSRGHGTQIGNCNLPIEGTEPYALSRNIDAQSIIRRVQGKCRH